MSDLELDQADPLKMARNAAAAVGRYADYQAEDPTGSYIAHAGQRGHDAAQLADDLKEAWLAGYETARFIWGLDEADNRGYDGPTKPEAEDHRNAAQWAADDALLQHRYEAET